MRASGGGPGPACPEGSPVGNVPLSPSLSQITTVPGPIAGRKIGVIADSGADLAGLAKVRKAAEKLGASVLVVAPAGGVLHHRTHTETVDRTLLTTRSVEFDAVVVRRGHDTHR